MASYQIDCGYPTANQFLTAAHLPSLSHPNVQSPLAATTLTSNSSSISPSPAAGADVSAASSNSDSSVGTLTPDAASQASALGSNNAATNIGCSSLELNIQPYPLTAANLISPASSSTSVFRVPPCCDNGRPMITDPVTGQTVCSCQYDANTSSRLAVLGNYSRLTSSAPVAGVGMSVFGSTYPSNEQNPYPSIAVETASPFYTSLNTPYNLKDGAGSTAPGAAASWTSTALQPSNYYTYDPTFGACGYGASYDLASRRKNATRESTATLKAWLNEHMKNPYPTKGEKIMLAIITKMTLTQVSTWFANARRRLKKENKMTWEPKNRTEDEDALVSDEEKDREEEVRGGEQRVLHSTSSTINKNNIPNNLSMTTTKRLEYETHISANGGVGSVAAAAPHPPPPPLPPSQVPASSAVVLAVTGAGVGSSGGLINNTLPANVPTSADLTAIHHIHHNLSGINMQPKDPYQLTLPQNLPQYSTNFYYPNSSQHPYHQAAAVAAAHHHAHQHHHQQQQQQQQQMHHVSPAAGGGSSSSGGGASIIAPGVVSPNALRTQISYDNTSSLLMPSQHHLLPTTYPMERR